MLMSLNAMSVSVELNDAHPNAIPWRGVLTRIDEPSDKPPNGSSGHRVLIPRAAAEVALPSLHLMGIDVADGLRDHNAKRKIGIITRAWIQGNDLCCEGILYAKDFPAEVQRIRERSLSGNQLGMSYEITDVEIEDPAAPLWVVRSCTFTGAAILERNAAAYRRTSLAARYGEQRGGFSMAATIEETLKRLKELKKLAAAMESPDEEAAEMTDEEKAAADEKAQADAASKAEADAKAKEDAEAAAKTDTEAKALAAQEHPDEDEDMQLFKKMLSNMPRSMMKSMMEGMMKGMGYRASAEEDEGEETNKVASLSMQRMKKLEAQLGEVSAAMELLTDAVQNMQNRLSTDNPAGGKRNLLTDDPAKTPQRKTLAATGTYAAGNWVGKYGIEQKTYTDEELSSVLRKHDISPEQRIAIKLDMEAMGLLSYT